MTHAKYSHHHSALASAQFDLQDAVLARSWDGEDWGVYLDDSLARWEVYIDATSGRVFTSEASWHSLDGPATVAFVADFITAYRGTGKRELRTLSDEVYQSAARARAAQEGTAHPQPGDRIAGLQARAELAVVAAAGLAGLSGRHSALQLQVFAVRHAQLEEDLLDLERAMARLRSAVDLSACALRDVLG